MLATGIAVFGVFHTFAEHTSPLLRCNDFTRIQKAVVDQANSRPPNSDQDPFLVQVCLWEVLWGFFSVQPLSWLLLVIV